ncbi:hypothetical protein LMJ53_15520 [Rheinheimera sp. UJ51]|uniref:hypothetical protein n=1 Tax=Rheinheimera sp. UJ51 TaxID=2892446 RepID=UPI001E6385BD|nr:hypothetical protein [Rheinheimera sp. UJ51]MCC5453129.1 hypothetical protein [Rheinheimera sp. UJ51]
MNSFERLQLTLENTPNAGKGFNSVSKMVNVYESLGETVSRRTITRDFLQLETSELIEFSQYQGTAKLFCKTKSHEPTFSAILSWLLVVSEDSIKKLCTESMLKAIEAELSLAKSKFSNTVKFEPQSNLCQFAKKLGPVASLLAKENLAPQVIRSINEALWDDSLELVIKYTDSAFVQSIHKVELKLINEKVYLCGKAKDAFSSTFSVPLERVFEAKINAQVAFQLKREYQKNRAA